MADTRSEVQLDDLDVFVRVIETRSMSAAARTLGVPKSTVSRAISRLEEALKTRLLQRTSRSLSATDAGTKLFEQAAPHVNALRGAGSIVRDLVEAPSGLIRVTAPNDIGAVLLGDVLARFAERYPDVEIDMVLTQRTVDLVAEGIDVAIRAGTLRDSSLVAKKLVGSRLILVAAPGYLKKRGTPKTLRDLEKHACVLFRPTKGIARWPLSTEEGEKVNVDVRGQLGGDDYSFICATVAAGAGIGLVPQFLASEALASGRLVRVLPDYATQAGAAYLVHASGRHVPRKIIVFRDFIIEAFREWSAL